MENANKTGYRFDRLLNGGFLEGAAASATESHFYDSRGSGSAALKTLSWIRRRNTGMLTGRQDASRSADWKIARSLCVPFNATSPPVGTTIPLAAIQTNTAFSSKSS